MKVLIVFFQQMDSNNGIHVFNLANHLVRLGTDCCVCLPQEDRSVENLGCPLFQLTTFKDLENKNFLSSIDILHAWTPREAVRKAVETMIKSQPLPYVVHLEDHEEVLTADYLRLPQGLLNALPPWLLDTLIPPRLSHPGRYRQFLQGASGITIVIDALKALVPPKVPSQTIWAGYEEELPFGRPPDIDLKRRLGIPDDTRLIVYTGNAHRSNGKEVSNLYDAVHLIRQQGHAALLLRTGVNHVRLSHRAPGECYRELGHVPRRDIPSLLSIADVLMQPGKPGPFNDFRFPSKLPEYLASGIPVILPRTNIGLHLKNNEECLLLDKGDAPDMATKITLLLNQPDLRTTLVAGGKRFAQQHLRWSLLAHQMLSFYQTILDRKMDSKTNTTRTSKRDDGSS